MKAIIDELIENSKPIDKDLIEKAKEYFKSREPIVQERIKQIKEDLANGKNPFLDFNELYMGKFEINKMQVAIQTLDNKKGYLVSCDDGRTFEVKNIDEAIELKNKLQDEFREN